MITHHPNSQLYGFIKKLDDANRHKQKWRPQAPSKYCLQSRSAAIRRTQAEPLVFHRLVVLFRLILGHLQTKLVGSHAARGIQKSIARHNNIMFGLN
ncbi:hypothetical protein C069_00857 [Brucella abortus I103_(UK3/01)]|nr:hypothetical protein C069_00857 [Brucella abortus I103_(UK3/01)]